MQNISRKMNLKKIMKLSVAIFTLLLLIACKNIGGNNMKITNSPSFNEKGVATNYEQTPMMTGDQGSLSIMWDLFIKDSKPTQIIPTDKTDLKTIDISEEIFVWFGHSSYMVQTEGKRILVDPVLSEAASPIPFFNKPFNGTGIYNAEDIPDIDYMVITHDHYDHLSKSVIKAIESKVGKVICGLGVGKLLRKWGYPEDKIIELDWNEKATLDSGFTINCFTTRHFSGRSLFNKNTTLWASFILETPEHKMYFGGDSGYGKHFKDIGEKFGVIDIVFLENGQYDERWKYIHMAPAETLAAAKDLNAKRLVPIHNSKFKLSSHEWNAPLIEIAKLHNNDESIRLITTMIGEKSPLWSTENKINEWWD